MKPILFGASETEYITNGLGRLSDTISCKVEEERNGKYELSMVYPVDGIHCDEITRFRQIYAVPAEGKDPQPFRIYEISKPMDGRIQISAEHIRYRLNEIPLMPFSASSANETLSKIKGNSKGDNPFEFWTDKNTQASFEVEEPTTIGAILGGTRGSILDVYGGEWEFDKYTAKLWSHRGEDRNVTIRYGKNLTDIKQEENISSTYSGVLPYWKGQNEDNSVNLITGSVQYADNSKTFPYQRIRVIDFSQDFQTAPTVDQLNTAAQSYIVNNQIGVPKVSIDIKFIQLWQTEEYKSLISIEHVNLCDTVHVEFPRLNVSATANVTKTVWDVLGERYIEVELGSARTTLSDNIKSIAMESREQIKNEGTLLEKSISRATNLITGGQGGYVFLKPNADGQPEELLILGDTNDYKTAKKVWRWNKNGLGYSSNGYNGPFKTAITSDGHIVADFIDTGKLTANIIRAGIITDADGKNFWNLDTSEFQLQSVNSIKDYQKEKEEIENYANDRATELSKGAEDLAKAAKKSADSKSTTYYGNVDPTISNYPASDWGNISDFDNHLGDLYYNVTTGSAFRLMAGHEALKITFSKESRTESKTWDYVVIYFKKDGKTYKTDVMGGDEISGKVVYIPSKVCWFYWHTDSSVNNYYGFSIDSVGKEVVEYDTHFSEGDLPVIETTIVSGTNYPESYHSPYSNSVDKLWEYTASVNISSAITYDWEELKDQDIQKALEAAGTAKATADGKIVTFAQSSAPENNGLTIGDLWVDTDDKNHMYRWSGTQWLEVRDGFIQEAANTAQSEAEKTAQGYANTAQSEAEKTAQGYANTAQSEAEKTAKGYADDAQNAAENYADEKVTDYDTALNQEKVFNKLTNNGALKGIYMSDGALYISADYIKTGTLSGDLIRGGVLAIGGDWDSRISVFNQFKNEIVRIDKSGIDIGEGVDNNPYYHTTLNADGFTILDTEYGRLGVSRSEINGRKSLSLNAWDARNYSDMEYSTSLSAGDISIERKSGSNTYVIFRAGFRGFQVSEGKSRIVNTKDYGTRLLYCYETPTPEFGDIGEGTIGEDGRTYVQIDPVFSETIVASQYQVFLQPYDKGNCYISKRESTYFVVEGTIGLHFGWEIKAKQSGFDQIRMETFDGKYPQDSRVNYGEAGSEHINNIKKGRVLTA